MLTYEQSENWKFVEGTQYMVSDQGRVRGLSGKILTQFLNTKGYLTFGIHNNKKRMTHRAVLMAFVGEPPTPKHQSAHNNGIKTDNRVENLRWATCKENIADNYQNGSARGRLNSKSVIEILTKRRSGVEVASLSVEYGVSKYAIHRVCTGKTWAKYTGVQ